MNKFRIEGVPSVSHGNPQKDRKPNKTKEETKKKITEGDTVELSEELQELLRRSKE